MSSSTSNFRRFLRIWVVPYALVSVVSLVALDLAFHRWVVLANPSSGATKLRRALTPVEPDEMAVFGSSRAASAFRPSLLGARVYNYGLEGVRSDVVALLLSSYTKRKRGAPILVGMDYEMFEPGPTYLGAIHYYLPNLFDPGVRALLQDNGAYRWYHGLIGVRYFGNFEYYAKDRVQGSLSLTKAFDRGSACDRGEFAPERFAQYVAQRLAAAPEIDLDVARALRFQAVIANAPERTFVLVTAPYHRSAEMSRRLTPAASQFFAGLAALPNVRTLELDYRDYPDELFSDTTHVNCRGAERFSRELAGKLRALR